VYNTLVSLHGNPILETAHLPDGRQAHIRVGIAEDPYIADRDLNTVVLELRIGGGVVAVLDTILDAEQESEARHLADRVREGLTAGTLQPTASSLGPLTDELL
jgi:hypothetical protein